MTTETAPFTRAFEAKIDDVSTPRRTVTAKINTNCVDRYNTVIVPRGGDWSNFMRSGPAVLWEHGNDPNRGRLPIAHCNSLKYRKMDDDILGVMQFKGDDFSNQVMEMYASGTLRSFSVEFLPDAAKSGRPTQEEVRANPTWGAAHTIYRSWELTGFSAVSYPGNPEALALAIERGFWVPEETRKQIESLKRNGNDSAVKDAIEEDPDEFDGLALDIEDISESKGRDLRSLIENKTVITRFNPNHDPHSGEFSSGGGGGGGRNRPAKFEMQSGMKGEGVITIKMVPKMSVRTRSDGGVQVHHDGASYSGKPGDVVAWSQPSKSGKYWVTAEKAERGATGQNIHTMKGGEKANVESIFRGNGRQESANARAETIGKHYREQYTSTSKKKVKDAEKFNFDKWLGSDSSKIRSSHDIEVTFKTQSQVNAEKASKKKRLLSDLQYDPRLGEILTRVIDRQDELENQLRAMSEGNGSQGGYATKTNDSDGDEDEDSEYDRYITHEDGQYVVHAEDGKVLGKHKTKGEAVAQLQAIEISKHKKSLSESREEDREAPLPVVQTFTIQDMNQRIVESAFPMFRMMYYAAQARTVQDLEDLARGKV